ncbi:MAG: LacI family DNA-binding transcriptional regulator [Kiritimatiellae bacterium]|nr:LacI family DNA-binding transcriptional regulator [Kiritimatiellia bacterium]
MARKQAKAHVEPARSLREIARQAGVSISTVSRALDPMKADLLSGRTVRKIQGIAGKLNFASNLNARRLKRGRTDTITVVLPLSVFEPTRYVDFSGATQVLLWQMMEGILKEARHWHHDIKLEPLFDPTAPADMMERVGYPFCDAVLFLGGYQHDRLIARVREKGLPFAVLSTHVLRQTDVPEISSDVRKGVSDAVKHLLAAGHTRVAFVGPEGSAASPNLGARLAAYRDTLAEAGCFREEAVMELADAPALQAWLDALPRPLPFTAAFCANDAMAWRLLQELAYRRVRVPEDMAIIGFDDNPNYRLGPKRLSTVRVPRRELGREAVRVLVQTMESKEPFRGKRVLPTEFIARDTG